MPINSVMMPAMMSTMMAWHPPIAPMPMVNNVKRPRGEPAPGLIDMYPGTVMGNSLNMAAFAARAAESNAEERHRKRHEAADREAAQLKEELKAAHAAATDVEQQVASLNAQLAAVEARAVKAESQLAEAECRATEAEEALRDRRAEAAAKRKEEIAALKAALKDGERQRVDREVSELMAEERRRAAPEVERQQEMARLAEQRAEQAELSLAAKETEVQGLKAINGKQASALAAYRSVAAGTERQDTARRQSRVNQMQQKDLDQTREVASKALQRIAELKQQPASATRQQAASQQQQAASQQQQAAPIFSTRPIKKGDRYLPIVLVLLRLLVTVCKVPQRNVAAVVDICFVLFTGALPATHYQVNARLVAEALRKLGTIDKERDAADAAAAAADPYPYSVNSDTGNDGAEREVAALGVWNALLNMTTAIALCCAHIAHDQSDRNGADVLERQLELAGRKPALCCGAGGDSTDHARKQREGLGTRLVAKGLEAGRMLTYGCVHHFKELELKAAFEADWPGNVAENFLWSLRFMIHKDVPFWRGVWADSGARTGPVTVYDNSLASMPSPTASKWECMDVACSKFLATMEVSEARRGIGIAMMEEFVDRARHLLRGTTDLAMPQKAGTHGEKSKFNVLAADLQNMQLLASIFAILDLASENSGPFHQWCKQVCPIYGFSNDLKAHLMAVKALEEEDFWVRAQADTSVAFPRLHAFMKRRFNRQNSELMNSEARRKLTASMTAAVEKGAAKNAEWMVKQYTAAPFLFGVVTDERHRQLAAQLILAAVGFASELKAAMAKAKVTAAKPTGAVQRRLQECFQCEAASGELRAWWDRWGFGASLAEWLLLATVSAQNYHNPVLRKEQTLITFFRLIPLFVLMVHNTRLESYVSKQKQLRQGHNTTAINVSFIFMHHASMERMRNTLSSWSARSDDVRYGAGRAVVQAKAGRNVGLTDTARSKLQRQALLMFTLQQELPKYTFQQLYSRGQASVASLLHSAEVAEKAVAGAVVERKIRHLQQSHTSVPCRARQAVKPPAAYASKAPPVPEALEQVAKQRGTGRSAAAIADRSKEAKAAKAAERPSQAGKMAVPTAAQKRKQKEEAQQALAKRQALPVEQRRAEAEARELEARAAAKRVRAEAEAEADGSRAQGERGSAEMEQIAKRARATEHVAEHQLLKAELRAWEAGHQRKLKPSDLRADVELKVKYIARSDAGVGPKTTC